MTIKPKIKTYTALILASLVVLSPALAFADCTSPAGVEADMFYNTTYKRVQYCDGTNWVNMGVSSLGSSDNLGNHTATQALAMGGFNITGAGAITGTSFTGVGTALTALNASNLGSGTVATARLGSGTANATTYLRGDGSWQAVPAGADNLGNHIATTVLRSDTTNTDDLGTTAIRWKDGWFAGAVTAGSFAGVGTSLTALNASNLSSGTVATARLGSGTANTTTYLRGDGSWQAVPASADNLGNHTATQALNMATFNITNGGDFTAVKYFHSSDARLKDNIKTIDDPLTLIGKLRGVEYTWKSDGEAAYGFIAQEVEPVIPDAVSENDQGIKAVEYDQVIAPLVEAVKAQQVQIGQLQQEIRELRGTTAE